MIKIIEGNIVNAKTDFIIHQVNCQGEMNTGVAKALRDYDEGIYKHYRKFCEFCKFESEELLGTCDAYLLKDRGQTDSWDHVRGLKVSGWKMQSKRRKQWKPMEGI